MKFLEIEYPLGTFPGQQSAGAYINETLAKNLDVYAKKIVDDMHFLIIITGNDAVGNGKSTMATHIGCYLTNKINKLHKTNNIFTSKNIALRAKDLVKQSFENPKYSVNVLDEGDDLTAHAMKDSTKEIRSYFRKCRQLNQILILILPSFFELPRFYALARSHALINVKFKGEFNRGYFDFYGPQSKKKLYLKGKKDWDYFAETPDFNGSFFANYTFFPGLKKETELYKEKKYDDMVSEEEKPETKIDIELFLKKKWFYLIYTKGKSLKGKFTIEHLANLFGITMRCGDGWLKDYRIFLQEEAKKEFLNSEISAPRGNTINTIENG